MNDITLDVQVSQLREVAARIERAAVNALREAVRPIYAKVVDLTPRWKGGLARNVRTRAEDGGRSQVVYNTGVVARVHEQNGTWSKWPPERPIREWVEGKLGLTGGEAASATFLIRRKIKRQGLTLPNVEGRGKMFQRTYRLFASTRAHVTAFRIALARELGGA